MKKLKFVTIEILMIFALSCDKSDPTPEGPTLVGTWKYQGWSNKDCADSGLNPLGFVCTDCKEIWTSSSITGSGWIPYSANYSINGNTITFTQAQGDINFPESTYSGTYELTATTLKITVDATWSSCKMVKSYTR
jgi:hypothetical protein